MNVELLFDTSQIQKVAQTKTGRNTIANAFLMKPALAALALVSASNGVYAQKIRWPKVCVILTTLQLFVLVPFTLKRLCLSPTCSPLPPTPDPPN